VQSLKDFGNAIVDNVIERFNSAISVLGSLASGFIKFTRGDLPGAAAELKNAGKEMVDVIKNNDRDRFIHLIKRGWKAKKETSDLILGNDKLKNLDKDLEINKIPFTVTSNKVEFNKTGEKTIFKPYTRVKGNIVYVTKLALNEEPLKIEIYSRGSNGTELVFSEKIENTKNIQKAYRLPNLLKSNYKIVYYTDGRTFTSNI